RRTKIVCTLGPTTASEERIEALVRAGMDVARINFSHGTQAEHARHIAQVRAVARRLERPVAILQDLQGPKIRTGPLAGDAQVTLRDGQPYILTTDAVSRDNRRVSTTYEPLPQEVRPGNRILLSDGAIELQVEEVKGKEIHCVVLHGGRLGEHQGINLPGVAISGHALTAKDRVDLVFGVLQHGDYIALSFVRSPEDVLEAKQLVAEATAGAIAGASAPPVANLAELHPAAPATAPSPAAGGMGGAQIPLIAKLERPEAIERLDAILEVADGVMVA